MNLLFVCFSPILAPFSASVNRTRYGKGARKRIGDPPGRRACPPVRRTRKSACPPPAPMRGRERSGRTKEAAKTEPRAMRPGVRRLSKNKEKPAVSEQQGSSRGQGPPRIGSASVRKCRFQAFSGIVFCHPAKYALAKRSQKSPCWTFLTSWEPRAMRPGVRCVGYFMLLYRKVTIWPLVQVALGLKVVAEVPLVIWGLWLTAHRTAS